MSVLPGKNIIDSHIALREEFKRRSNPSGISWLTIWQHHGRIVDKDFFNSAFFTQHESYLALYEHPAIPRKHEFAELTMQDIHKLIRENTCEHSRGLELDVTIAPRSMAEFLICNHDGQMLYISEGDLIALRAMNSE